MIDDFIKFFLYYTATLVYLYTYTQVIFIVFLIFSQSIIVRIPLEDNLTRLTLIYIYVCYSSLVIQNIDEYILYALETIPLKLPAFHMRKRNEFIWGALQLYCIGSFFNYL